MAGTFPILKSGNTVFYPLQESHSFGTGIVKFLDDSEQRWRSRLMLRRFKLTFNDVNAYDTSLILQFYRSQFGKFDGTWSILIGAETIQNLSFDSDSFQMTESKRNRTTMIFDVVQLKSSAPSIPTTGTYFPQINSNGIMTVLPYSSQFDYRTTLVELECGKRYTYKWRTEPLGKYTLNFSSISDAELAIVQNFFYSKEGKKKEFLLLDPGGNLVNRSDDFSDASWVKSNISVGSPQTDPQNGNLATRLTSISSDGFMHTNVIPGGNASGFVICASAWVRAISPGQTLMIGLMDSTLSIIGFTIWVLPQGQWKRIHHTMTVATGLAIRASIGGLSTWISSQAIDVFSAQCSPMPGPGPRMLTPGMDGLRPKCRFDTDELTVNKIGLNNNSLILPIAEYR